MLKERHSKYTKQKMMVKDHEKNIINEQNNQQRRKRKKCPS